LPRHAGISSGTRVAVLEVVRALPGASLSDVARAVGKNRSTVEWHARFLVKAGVVRGERDGSALRLYVVGGLSRDELFRARLGRSGAAYEAVAGGLARGPTGLARVLGISYDSARWHLQRLVDLGAVRREGRAFVAPP